MWVRRSFRGKLYVATIMETWSTTSDVARMELMGAHRAARSFLLLTAAHLGDGKLVDAALSGVQPPSAPEKTSYCDAVDKVAMAGLALLRSDDTAQSGAGASKPGKGAGAHAGTNVPIDKTAFVELAKAAYQACVSASKRGGRDGVQAQCTLVWVSTLAAKVLMLVYCDVSAALTWSSYASGAAHKCTHPLFAKDCAVALLEAVLLRAELYEHVGNLDGCLVYLREAAAMAQALPAPAYSSIVTLHSVRVWHRSASPKLHSTVEELVGTGGEQIYAAAWQLADDISSAVRSSATALDALFSLRPEEDRTAKLPTSTALRFRYLGRYWDITAVTHPYHTFLPSSLRSQVESVLAAHPTMPAASVKLSGLSPDGAGSSRVSNDLLESASSSGAFDVIRDVRRRRSLEITEQCGQHAFLAFLAGAASCGVAAESLGDSGADHGSTENESQPSSRPHVLGLAEASKCITEGLLGSTESVQHMQDKIARMLRHCTATTCAGTPGATSAVCFLAVDRGTSALLIGRVDDAGVPLVAALPMEDRLSELLVRWDELQERNQAMLRQGLDPTQVAQLGDEQKRAWWAARQRYDADIEATMSDLQELLGVWRVLLSTAPLRVALSIESVRGVLQKYSPAKGKKFTGSVIDELAMMLVPWLQLFGNNLVAGEGDGGRTMPCFLACVRDSVCEVLSQHSALAHLSASELREMAGSLLSLCTPSPSLAAADITPLQATSECEEEDRLNSLKVTELRTLLKQAGLDAVGKKQDLVDRLLEHSRSKASNTAANVSSTGASNAAPGSATGHLVLLLDEHLQRLPVECMPALRSVSCSRVPSFAVLLTLIDAALYSRSAVADRVVDQLANEMRAVELTEVVPTKSKAAQKGKATKATASQAENKENQRSAAASKAIAPDSPEWKNVAVTKGWYALDIEGNLPATRETLQPFLHGYSEQWHWKSAVATVPAEDTTRQLHESSDLFIFCGHGAGERMHDTFRLRKFTSCPASLLWGCSSGRLKARGVHDAAGTALYYLIAGSPFLVANLWDVTDKDIDKLCVAHMGMVLPQVGESGTSSGAVQVAAALAKCRSVCRMPFAVGAAPVVYGIPALFTAEER